MTLPGWKWELSQANDFPLLLACDEVGRGCLVGPLAVGVTALFSARCQLVEFPAELNDSKLLSAVARERLLEPLFTCLTRVAVGYASQAEIAKVGLTAAQRLAANRALGAISCADSLSGYAESVRSAPETLGGPTMPDRPLQASLLLDGKHNWLGNKLTFPGLQVTVQTQVGADRSSVLTAAASVVAKVYRDRLMKNLAAAYPQYGWHKNVGYPTRQNRDAIKTYGPTPFIRRNLAKFCTDSSFGHFPYVQLGDYGWCEGKLFR